MTGEYDLNVPTPKDLEFRLLHVGINTDSEEQSLRTAQLLSTMFRVQPRAGKNSNFVADMFEIMKFPMRGEKGHIAMGTNSVEDAMAYLEQMGFTFNRETIKYAEDGRIRFVYMKDEIQGFAFHFNLMA